MMKNLAIFGVPRSGTSWLSQIFNSHPNVTLRFQPLFSYGHKGRLTSNSTVQDINDFFTEILESDDKFALMLSDSQKNYPCFVKSSIQTHIVFKETRYLHILANLLQQCPNIKVVGIVRNPLACLSSWIKAPKEFNPLWDVHQEWRFAPSKNQGKPEEFYGFEKWKEVAENFLLFEALFPQQFKLVRYDQLISNPENITANLFEFCGLSMHPQVKEFLVSSRTTHDTDPYSVFRAKANDNDWKNVVPADVVDEIMLELKNTPLQVFLEGAVNG